MNDAPQTKQDVLRMLGSKMVLPETAENERLNPALRAAQMIDEAEQRAKTAEARVAELELALSIAARDITSICSKLGRKESDCEPKEWIRTWCEQAAAGLTHPALEKAEVQDG